MKKLVSKVLSLSIGTKLAITFVALVCMTSIPLSFVVIRLSENIFYENIIKALKGSIAAEELQLRYYVINKDYWNIFKFIKGIAQIKHVYEVAVVDGKGKVLAHSNPERFPIGSEYKVRGDIVYPLPGIGSEVGYVILTLDRESMWAEFRPAKLLIISSAVPFTTLGILLGFFISYRIKSRLSKIKASMEQVRKGSIDKVRRVEFLEKDELQDFADFLFETIETLRNYYQNIDYAQRFYMSLINSINEIILVVDEEGRILYANDKVRHLGYEINEVVGLELWYLIELQDNLEQGYREVVVKGKVRNVPALMGIARYGDWDVVTLIDISERKEMEEKMKRMELFSALGEMSANFAHELKNAMLPLTLLMSDDELSKEDVDTVKKSLSRILKLVNMFLRFARPFTTQKVKFKLKAMVEDALSVVEVKAKEKGVKVMKEVEDAEIVSYKDMLEVILVNLLSNAIDAVGEGGEVGLRAYLRDKVLHLEVWDKGEGIPRDRLNKIFEPFYTTKRGGSGLGLSIVLRNVYLLGGNIEVESEPGMGSLFKVSVPLQEVKDEKNTPYRG